MSDKQLFSSHFPFIVLVFG